MLQKIVNGIAIASGVVSLTVVGLAGYVYIRKDAIIENVKSKVMESVLPSGLGSTGGLGLPAPSNPTPTEPVLPSGLGSAGGLGLPSPSTPTPEAPASPIPLGF